MKIFKIIGLLFVCAMISSCESDDDNDSVSNSDTALLTKSCSVLGHSYDVHGAQSGDRFELNCDNNLLVIITDETAVFRQRPSCSGFEAGSYDSIQNGDYIEITYTKNDMIYSNPNIVRPLSVDAYRPECLNGTIPSGGDQGCSTCDFFN